MSSGVRRGREQRRSRNTHPGSSDLFAANLSKKRLLWQPLAQPSDFANQLSLGNPRPPAPSGWPWNLPLFRFQLSHHVPKRLGPAGSRTRWLLRFLPGGRRFTSCLSNFQPAPAHLASQRLRPHLAQVLQVGGHPALSSQSPPEPKFRLKATGFPGTTFLLT